MLLAVDGLATAAALVIALFLRFSASDFGGHLALYAWVAAVLIACRLATFLALRLYDPGWRDATLSQLVVALVGLLVASGVGYAVVYLVIIVSPLLPLGFPRSVALTETLLAIAFAASWRMANGLIGPSVFSRAPRSRTAPLPSFGDVVAVTSGLGRRAARTGSDAALLVRSSPTVTLDAGMVRAALLAYGLLVAGVAVDHYVREVPDEGMLMSTRSYGVRESIRILDAGGPPLVITCQVAGGYCGLPGADDPGIYLYLPQLGRILHGQSPEQLLKWLFIGAMAPVIAAYPLLMYQILRSAAAALVAPLLIVVGFSFLENSEIYWIMSWAQLLGLPLLAIAWRQPTRRMMAILTGVMLAASFANSLRGISGLPLLIAAIGVVLTHERTWLRRIVLASLLLLPYLAISPTVVAAASAYRDHALGVPSLPGPYTTAWHSIYIGLGYLANPYGIRYDDNIAYEHVLAVDPSVKYLSPEYAVILRGLVLKIVVENPLFVLETVALKAAIVLWTAVSQLGILLVMLPVMLRSRSGHSTARLCMLLALPALVQGFAAPVSVMPYVRYQLMWLGALGFLGIVAGSWAVGALPAGITAALRVARGTSWRSQLRPRLRSRAVLAALLLLPVVALGLYEVSMGVEALGRSAFYRQNENPVSITGPTGPLVGEWNAGTAASDFQAQGGVETRLEGEVLRVATNPRRFDYQLVGPLVSLQPGTYRVFVDGRVVQGGIDVGVLKADPNVWLVQTFYWNGQFQGGDHLMTAEFKLDRSAEVKVVLSNWQPAEARSEWLVRRITLERVD